MNAATVKESMALLAKALALDPGHYESLRLRAQTYRISERFADMEDDALAMIVSQPRNPRGYALRAIARRGLKKYTEAIEDHDLAIKYSSAEDSQYVQLHKDRCKTLLEAGEYRRLIADAEKYLDFRDEEAFFHFHVLCAHTALGQYEHAESAFRQIRALGAEAMELFVSWSMKYVFDTLGAGKSWHPGGDTPQDDAFFFMNEADEYYHEYAPRFRRVITNGFSPSWSPDGKKIAFSLGVAWYSGVAVYDLASKETELLIAPGKDPVYSPDGEYIAFVRSRQILPLEEMSSADHKFVEKSRMVVRNAEVWIIRADGTEPRRIAMGGWPAWSPDSQRVYYKSRIDPNLYSVAIGELGAQPTAVADCGRSSFPNLSPDAKYLSIVQCGTGNFAFPLKIVGLLDPRETLVRSEPLVDVWCANWAPNGYELSLGGEPRCSRMGLWILNRETGQLAKVLNGMPCQAKWSPDGSKLAVYLGHPFLETWITDLPQGQSTIEALGIVQTRDEHHRQMADRYEKIIELTPKDVLSHGRLAACYSLLNDEEASRQAFIRYWTVRIELNPNNAFLHGCRGSYYHINARMIGEAISDYETALRLKPDFVAVLDNLAWLYAACPQAQFRNGAKAVEYATKACELTHWKNPNCINTLGAAYAEMSDFDAAVKWQRAAIDLLPENTSESRADYESRLKLYQESKPWRGW